jgi:rhomboid protease GluP
MANVAIDKKDQLVMSLVHYFVTKENYSPVLVQGAKDEIWLQNLEGPYKVIRINTNYIQNDEQYKFDMFKVQNILQQIRKKTLSFKLNALNIYTNTESMNGQIEIKNIDNVIISNLNGLKSNETIQSAFPQIETKLIKEKNGLDLIYNVSNDINQKTEKENKIFEKIFKPKTIIMTNIMIALCIIVFVLTYFFGNGSTDSKTLINFGANYAPLVKYGEYYRLITCAFLHAGVIHLFVNMYSLFVVGTQVETFIGKWKFLFVYLISALSGSLMSIIFNANIVSVGASGAIFGLLGSLLYFGYHYRMYLSNTLLTQIVPIIILNLFIGFMSTNIDNGAHIGGLVGGLLATMAVGIDGKTEKSEKINGAIVLTIYLVFLSYIVFFVK